MPTKKKTKTKTTKKVPKGKAPKAAPKTSRAKAGADGDASPPKKPPAWTRPITRLAALGSEALELLGAVGGDIYSQAMKTSDDDVRAVVIICKRPAWARELLALADSLESGGKPSPEAPPEGEQPDVDDTIGAVEDTKAIVEAGDPGPEDEDGDPGVTQDVLDEDEDEDDLDEDEDG